MRHEHTETLAIVCSDGWIDGYLSEVNKRQEMFSLGGVDDGEYLSPYARAEQMLKQAKKNIDKAQSEIEALKKHSHQWDEDDYCKICSADGRA